MADESMTGSGVRQSETIRVRSNANAFGLTVGQVGELVRDRDVDMALHLGWLEEQPNERPRRRTKRGGL